MRKLEPGEVLAIVVILMTVGYFFSPLHQWCLDVKGFIENSENPKWYVRVAYHVVVASSGAFVAVLMFSFINSRINKYKS